MYSPLGNLRAALSKTVLQGNTILQGSKIAAESARQILIPTQGKEGMQIRIQRKTRRVGGGCGNAPVDMQQHERLADLLELDFHVLWEGVTDQGCGQLGRLDGLLLAGLGQHTEKAVCLSIDHTPTLEQSAES
jgi:hypothetical protein